MIKKNREFLDWLKRDWDVTTKVYGDGPVHDRLEQEYPENMTESWLELHRCAKGIGIIANELAELAASQYRELERGQAK